MTINIRKSAPEDLQRVLTLLDEVDLPVEGVREHFDDFFVLIASNEVAGCIGAERYDDKTLLRSLAVSPNLRKLGAGTALTQRLLNEARAAGVGEVVLLTTTAEDFFARLFGFERAERSQYDEVFQNSPEWKLPRCSSAACMSLKLTPRQKPDR